MSCGLKHRQTAIIVLLLTAVGFIGFAFLTEIMNSLPAGTFTADYYYLPMHEYVDPAQHYDNGKEVDRSI